VIPTPEPATTVASSDTASVVVIVEPETKATDSVKILQPQKEMEVRPDTAATAKMVVVLPPGGLHTVQPKETLYALSKMYNVAVMDLVSWNNLDLQQGIKAGQQLRVSAPEASSEEQKRETELIHEVQPTDTLYGIARKYGVTIKQIMEWNEKKDFTLTVGEKLKVKSIR
jgi:membrane-bound lytic murein transglycosylase D